MQGALATSPASTHPGWGICLSVQILKGEHLIGHCPANGLVGPQSGGDPPVIHGWVVRIWESVSTFSFSRGIGLGSYHRHGQRMGKGSMHIHHIPKVNRVCIYVRS